MFRVLAFVNDIYGTHTIADERVGENVRAALRHGWELIGGIPGAVAYVWSPKGRALAYVQCDHRGEIQDAGMCSGQVVTLLNPQGPIFAGAFAE